MSDEPLAPLPRSRSLTYGYVELMWDLVLMHARARVECERDARLRAKIVEQFTFLDVGERARLGDLAR